MLERGALAQGGILSREEGFAFGEERGALGGELRGLTAELLLERRLRRALRRAVVAVAVGGGGGGGGGGALRRGGAPATTAAASDGAAAAVFSGLKSFWKRFFVSFSRWARRGLISAILASASELCGCAASTASRSSWASSIASKLAWQSARRRSALTCDGWIARQRVQSSRARSCCCSFMWQSARFAWCAACSSRSCWSSSALAGAQSRGIIAVQKLSCASGTRGPPPHSANPDAHR